MCTSYVRTNVNKMSHRYKLKQLCRTLIVNEDLTKSIIEYIRYNVWASRSEDFSKNLHCLIT